MQLSRDWVTRSTVAGMLLAIIALPFALRTGDRTKLEADDIVVVATPHNEAIRAEFARGFSRWYQQKTGRSIAVDWRTIGGTSEITRFVASEYTASFRNYWEGKLGRTWNAAVQTGFDRASVTIDSTPDDDTDIQAARRAFLQSDVSCGVDLFFGGGVYDFVQHDGAGRLIDSGIFDRHPEWFGPEVIPQTHNGELYWSENHRWASAALASFGILFNRDALGRLGIDREPDAWQDLTDPRYFGELALADPTKSSSIAKAFEMVVQREIQTRWHALQLSGATGAEAQAVREGWTQGLAILQLLGANARYFTDSSQKVPIDVSQGDAAAGMCIDFYGRAQAEAVMRRDQSPRLHFVTPPGGSVFSGDPIGIFRGAPHREAGLAFITFVLSPEGQNLWNLRAGTPDGPEVFQLRRLPIRRDSYSAEYRPYRSDPTVNPYAAENDFVYVPAWTSGIFREMAFLIRIVCIDTHPELIRAWRAIIDAGLPVDALAMLQDFSAIDYETTTTSIHDALHSGDPLDEIRLAKRLASAFRKQYQHAAEIAREHNTSR